MTTTASGPWLQPPDKSTLATLPLLNLCSNLTPYRTHRYEDILAVPAVNSLVNDWADGNGSSDLPDIFTLLCPNASDYGAKINSEPGALLASNFLFCGSSPAHVDFAKAFGLRRKNEPRQLASISFNLLD